MGRPLLSTGGAGVDLGLSSRFAVYRLALHQDCPRGFSQPRNGLVFGGQVPMSGSSHGDRVNFAQALALWHRPVALALRGLAPGAESASGRFCQGPEGHLGGDRRVPTC